MRRSKSRYRHLHSSLLASAGLLALATGIAPAFADDSGIETVIVTGTRQTGLTASDSPAPIQVIGADVLAHVGEPDLMQALAQNVPSFNAQGYGADTAALTLSAALRGLNPDDTLVLVNGKRRNPTANLQVDGGSPYQGAAAADLSFIPEAAIDHIEVLQDGAAAQYGSDAIAGVVNIITKTADSGGSLSATGGQYYEGDGDTGEASFNKGFSFDDGKGYLNLTGEDRYHGFSRQGGADQRFSYPDGSLKPGQSPYDTVTLPKVPGYPDMNNIYGDPQYDLYNGFYTGGYHFNDAVEFYSFGSYGYRTDSAYENYRKPDKVSGVTSTGVTVYPRPYGFSPREAIGETEYSFTGGFKGNVDDWHWDLSTTYGSDHDDVYTRNSANAQLFPVLQALSPTPIVAQANFYDGSYHATEWTSNLDIAKEFAIGLASPLNVAFGGEERRDTFGIGEGEPSSYYGAGAQSFTGYGATDAGTHGRTSYAGYIDLAATVLPNLYVDLAGRYEHFSDFGEATVAKATARYDFSDAFAVRGTVSTGFRAPTLQEEYYSGTNVSPNFAQVQLPPNSPAALDAGFGPLRPELSHNYSVGFVSHPTEDLQFTADAYEIDIKNRIVGSGFLLGSVINPNYNPALPLCTPATHPPACTLPQQTVISQAVLNSIMAHGNTLDSGISYAGIQLFTNGVNTRTQGIESTVTYASDFEDYGHVDWSGGFNYNDSSITKLAALPAEDVNVGIGQVGLLSRNATSSLVDATPKFKFVLGAFWTMSRWSVNLREEIYGPSSQWVSLNGSGVGGGASHLMIGTAPITDVDIGYSITDGIKLDVGANNLFDKKPPTVPTIDNGGNLQPADGNNVYGEPDQFSPYGINGGYYYGRITVAL